MNLRLRDIDIADLDTFFAHQFEPDAIAMTASVPRPRQAFDELWAKILADTTHVKLTIEVDGQPAGYVASFHRLEKLEVCYWIGRRFWSRGIATAAVKEILERIPLRPIWARVAKQNPASQRVLEKCGFVVDSEDVYRNSAGIAVEEFLLRRD